MHAIASPRPLLCLNSCLRSLPRVPTLLRDSLGTPETIFLYQMPLYLLFVPHEVFSCTGRVYAPRWYLIGLFPVPNVTFVAARTQKTICRTDCGASYFWCPFAVRASDPLVLYQDSFVVPFVRHSPFSCTECVSEFCSYVKGLSSVPNRIEEVFYILQIICVPIRALYSWL